MFVNELQKEQFNPVLLYKRQHERNPDYMLPVESFVFAMQTEFQMDCYQQHATKVLCVDATHGTNAYSFKLITVMVADEFGQGEVYVRMYFIVSYTVES